MEEKWKKSGKSEMKSHLQYSNKTIGCRNSSGKLVESFSTNFHFAKYACSHFPHAFDSEKLFTDNGLNLILMERIPQMAEKKSKPSTAEPGRKQRRAYGKPGDRLRHALKGDGIANAPKVSTLLLDTFVKRNGVLKAAHAEAKGLCDEGGFKSWRKQLEDLGWIVYDEKHARLSQRYTDHIAGYKLLAFINEAKAALAEFATMDDIRSLQLEKANRSELMEKADLSVVTELKAEIVALKKQFGLAQEEVVSTKDFAAKAYRALKRNARQILGPNASEAAVDRLVNEMINAEDDESTPPVWPPLVAN